MRPRFEPTPDDPSTVALLRGPLVLAADLGPADASFNGPAPALVGDELLAALEVVDDEHAKFRSRGTGTATGPRLRAVLRPVRAAHRRLLQALHPGRMGSCPRPAGIGARASGGARQEIGGRNPPRRGGRRTAAPVDERHFLRRFLSLQSGSRRAYRRLHRIRRVREQTSHSFCRRPTGAESAIGSFTSRSMAAGSPLSAFRASSPASSSRGSTTSHSNRSQASSACVFASCRNRATRRVRYSVAAFSRCSHLTERGNAFRLRVQHRSRHAGES